MLENEITIDTTWNVIVCNYDPKARVNSLSSPSFKSDTTQKDMPARVQ